MQRRKFVQQSAFTAAASLLGMSSVLADENHNSNGKWGAAEKPLT